MSVRIAPFWFTPKAQDRTPPARFKIRPLSEAQLLELMDTCRVDERLQRALPTNKTWAEAARLAVMEFTDAYAKDDTTKLEWPRDWDMVPWYIQLQIGVKVYRVATSLDAPGDDDTSNEGDVRKNS